MDSLALTAIGTLGKDPELRFTAGSRATTSFSMACTHRFKRDDAWEEETSWIPVVAYGSLAENISSSCTKGTRVIVSGRLRAREWDSDDGQRHKIMELVADEVAPSVRFATAIVEKNPRQDKNR